MLFVNDSEAEIAELNCILYDGVGADEQMQRTVEQLFVNDRPFSGAGRSGKQFDVKSDFRGQFSYGMVMLCGQNLGRSHKTGLIPVVYGQKHGHKRYERFA